jgi:DNA-binding MarR family transcriptional regulator
MSDIAAKRPTVPAGALSDGPTGPDTSDFVLEDFLTFRLLILARALDRQAKRTYGESFGLSLVEWRILAKLGTVGSATVNRLATWMNYDKAQISRAVGALVEAGHLARATNASDTRSAILTLTPEGREFHLELMAFGRERQRLLLSLLKPDERESLYEIIGVLTDHLRKDDVKPTEQKEE